LLPVTVARVPREVSLVRASQADAALLANLLELYIHDLSDVFQDVELGADGRFGYRHLDLYWSEADRGSAFLIRCDGRVSGFALVTRGSPAASDPQTLDVAEFFVMRRYRREGVGRRAAIQLWEQMPGSWMVRVCEANAGALKFWTEVVAGFTNGAYAEAVKSGQPAAWRVFSFESGARR